VSKLTQRTGELLVIQQYLQGKSMNKIANETGIFKRQSTLLISEWKEKIGSSDIDEIKEFVDLVKKSGISIEHFAKGFRTTNILKGYGIKNEDTDDEGNGITGNNNDHKEFSTFIEDVTKTANITVMQNYTYL
jgi:hypothetical protein